MQPPLKYFFLCVIILLFQWNAFAQDRTIDSLKQALRTAKHDTTRCNILNTMIEAEDDDNVWSVYNVQLKVLAETGIKSDPTNKKIYLKHLAATFNNLGYLANQKGNFALALKNYYESKRIQEEINDKKEIANCLNNIGLAYKSQGHVQKGLDYYLESLKMKREMGDKKGIATSLLNIGRMYDDQGNITEALEYYHESLKIREELGEKTGIANCLNNMAYLYDDQGNRTKALEYYNSSLKIYEELGYKVGIAMSLNNIGTIYSNRNEHPKALEYYGKSLTIYREAHDDLGIARSMNNIGKIYDKEGDVSKAEDYYTQSLNIFERMANKAGIASLMNSMASLKMLKGDLGGAVSYAIRGLELAKELGFPININNSAYMLKLIYKKQNKYKEAFEMYELEIKMRDSLNNQQTQKAAVKKEMQYAYEKKEIEAKAEQDKKDIIVKEELKQKENERNYFIAGFGLVIILALFIFRGYRQKQKANVLITEQKALVEEKQKEIIDSIHYAQRIQNALITPEKYIDKSLNKLQGD